MLVSAARQPVVRGEIRQRAPASVPSAPAVPTSGKWTPLSCAALACSWIHAHGALAEAGNLLIPIAEGAITSPAHLAGEIGELAGGQVARPRLTRRGHNLQVPGDGGRRRCRRPPRRRPRPRARPQPGDIKEAGARGSALGARRSRG